MFAEEYDRVPVTVEKVSVSDGGLTITWTPVPGAVAYEIPDNFSTTIHALVAKEPHDD